MLATLAMLYIVNGIHLTFTKGYSVYSHMPMTDGTIAPGKMEPWFLWIGQEQIASVPVPVILMVGLII
jgi:simple sugar transport system permease protein